jgi:hypothetical protein
MIVEIRHQRLCQRVVKQFLTVAVPLFQLFQLLSHLCAIAFAPHNQA